MFDRREIGELIVPFLGAITLIALLYFTVTNPDYWALMRELFL